MINKLLQPKISIITPSFNQADFLERTILSIIEQDYPNIELIIIDGGSTDGSVEVIKKYESSIAYWVSEKDNGQSHAINKGLQVATGDWVAWQNSDDIYYPGAFKELVSAAKMHPEAGLIIGDMNLIDEQDSVLSELHFVKASYNAIVAEGMVLSNQSAFWKSKLHDEIGIMDESLELGFELDWFLRLAKSTNCYAVHKCLGAFRIHSNAKTQKFVEKNRQAMQRVRERHQALPNVPFVWCYRLKRILQLIMRRDFSYLFRGLLRRFSNVIRLMN